jgi:hypothetical protein
VQFSTIPTLCIKYSQSYAGGILATKMLIGVDWHSSEMASFLHDDEPVVVGMRVGMPGVDA